NQHRPSFDRQRVTRAPKAQGRPETPEPLHLHDGKRPSIHPRRVLQAHDPAGGEGKNRIGQTPPFKAFVRISSWRMMVEIPGRFSSTSGTRTSGQRVDTLTSSPLGSRDSSRTRARTYKTSLLSKG